MKLFPGGGDATLYFRLMRISESELSPKVLCVSIDSEHLDFHSICNNVFRHLPTADPPVSENFCFFQDAVRVRHRLLQCSGQSTSESCFPVSWKWEVCHLRISSLLDSPHQVWPWFHDLLSSIAAWEVVTHILRHNWKIQINFSLIWSKMLFI